ncbi:MAG TPA: HD domain-containing protein [Methanoregulaceae archaeon]|nr:HD domain-containing protein [Methanoregulaceae archaeon]
MESVEEKAIVIVSRAATGAHQGQTRKDGKTPFIVHPERVAKCVAHYGGNHVGIIAAWLHDVIENNDEGAAIVREALEETCLPENNLHEIYAIVLALTKNPAIPGKRERFADTLDRILHAPGQAILVKICDRMDNLIDARDQGQQFLSEYLDLTDQLIAAFSDAAIRHGYTEALEQLKVVREDVGFFYEAKFF